MSLQSTSTTATANETLSAVSRFLRRNPDAAHCYPCLEKHVAAAGLAATLKGYPGTPYSFEKTYCTVCGKWMRCVTFVSA